MYMYVAHGHNSVIHPPNVIAKQDMLGMDEEDWRQEIRGKRARRHGSDRCDGTWAY